MSKQINIANIPKGVVIAALYNASRPLGMGFMQYDPNPMTPEEGERKDNNGNYEPSNCKWATFKEQANNRRTPINTKPINTNANS